MSRYSKNGDTQYHVNGKGVVSPCSARVKPCPLQHWDSFNEALDNREPRHRPETVTSKDERIKFDVFMEADPKEPEFYEDLGDDFTGLSALSRKAKDYYERTGKHPRAPFGEIKMSLGNDKSVIVKRIPYRVFYNNASSPVGGSYEFRYDSSKKEYDVDKFDLIDHNSYMAMQNCLQMYVTDAINTEKEKGNDTEQYRDNLQKAYSNTLKLMDEMEVISRGAAVAYKELGLDIFTKDNPQVLSYDAKISSSAIQIHDIVESIKAHAEIDKEPKEIEIHVYDSHPSVRSEGMAEWGLRRTTEGDWFMSGMKNGKKVSFMIDKNDPKIALKVTNTIKSVYSFVDPQIAQRERDNSIQYATRLLTEVDKAVENYEKVMHMRMQEKARKEELRAQKEQEMAQNIVAATEKPAFRKKILGIFG